MEKKKHKITQHSQSNPSEQTKHSKETQKDRETPCTTCGQATDRTYSIETQQPAPARLQLMTTLIINAVN